MSQFGCFVVGQSGGFDVSQLVRRSGTPLTWNYPAS